MAELQLDIIRTDGGTQPRTQINFITIEEYAEAMEAGANFPAVDVVYDGTDYWLVDGFHRVAAAKKAELTHIAATVTPGTLADAQWRSYGVNATHGLRRSNEDKRRAVEAALKHEKAATMTNVDIARHCGVSEGFVRKLRPIFVQNEDTRTVTRNGVTYQMDTANIGQRSEAAAGDEQPRLPEIRNGEPVKADGLTDGEWVDRQMEELKKKLPPVHPPAPQVIILDNPPPAPWEVDSLPTPKPYAPQHSTAATFEQVAPPPPKFMADRLREDAAAAHEQASGLRAALAPATWEDMGIAGATDSDDPDENYQEDTDGHDESETFPAARPLPPVPMVAPPPPPPPTVSGELVYVSITIRPTGSLFSARRGDTPLAMENCQPGKAWQRLRALEEQEFGGDFPEWLQEE